MPTSAHELKVHVGPQRLPGDLWCGPDALGLIVFAHGSGSSRMSPRNRFVAELLRAHRLGTLLFDLLSDAEAADRRNVFDIELLGARMVQALDWLQAQPDPIVHMRVGLFGASTGAAAALRAAASRPDRVAAVVSRGGRPDLAGETLAQVQAPTLLIVGGLDTEVLQLNRWALRALGSEKRLEVVPGATHLFEEPGALEAAAGLAGRWFADHLGGR